MATTSYNQTIDTLVSTTIDAYSGDPLNLLTKSGEKFLNRMRQAGRIFYIKDCEKIRHPLLYGHGEDSSYYTPDQLTGTPEIGGLGTEAVELLTQAQFLTNAATRNINMPQSMPAGDVISYVDTLIQANLMKIWNEEERLFLTGQTAQMYEQDATNNESKLHNSMPQSRAPLDTDDSYKAGLPMSLLGLLTESTGDGVNGEWKHDAWVDGADVTINSNATKTFAGVKTSDVGAEWMPQFYDLSEAQYGTADTAGGMDLVGALQRMIDNAGFSESEHVTDIFTDQSVFENLLQTLRDQGALPDPIRADMVAGWNHYMPFGGVMVSWSRYMNKHEAWNLEQMDRDDTSPYALTAGQTQAHPIIGLNLNSLRMNIVMNSSPIDGQLGFIRQIGDGTYPHPTLTNLFKRIEWKRSYSVDGGRRSMFMASGATF
jgi:hypothetical protein